MCYRSWVRSPLLQSKYSGSIVQWQNDKLLTCEPQFDSEWGLMMGMLNFGFRSCQFLCISVACPSLHLQKVIMKKWRDNEDLFKKELLAGEYWQKQLTDTLNFYGIKAVSHSLPFRKDISETYKYTDTKDILCGNLVIECKSRRLRLKNGIPYKELFIDTVSGWEAKTKKPDIYVCISQLDRHVVLDNRIRQQKLVKEKSL